MNLKERKRQMRREIKARVARLDGAYCRKADSPYLSISSDCRSTGRRRGYFAL